MISTRSLAPALVIAALLPAAACRTTTPAPRFVYPEARRSDQVDVYHGVQVADPYRWLEDPDSPETREWVEEENELTFGYLAEIPQREEIEHRLTELWDYERYGVPVQRGERLFYGKNDGLQNQSVLYVVDRDGAEPRVLLDPNTLSEDGTVALANWVPSPDGKLLAYGLSDGGSDWRTWKVKDVDTGEDLADVVSRNKFGGLDWSADADGFFYERFERPQEGTELRAHNTPAEICYHHLGTDEADDEVVVERPEEGFSLGFDLTESRNALVVSRREIESRNNELYYLPLVVDARTVNGVEASSRIVGHGPEQPLAVGFDAQYRFVGDDGRTLWVMTNQDAPRWRIVGIDPAAPADLSRREIVPETREAIQSADSVGGRLIVEYLKDATSLVRVLDSSGSLLDQVELRGLGSVSGFRGDAGDRDTYYAFTSFTRPTAIYRYDLEKKESELFRAPAVDFDPDDYETEQVFYPSKDGTLVPMFLTHKKGLRLTRDNPTYLYAYGGFNISITPSFSVQNLVWLEHGGLLAIPNLRGGGEYGEEWHEAGTKLKKQNVFDDFIAAAEWLTHNGYTRPDKLAVAGGSNGGLLVGACMTQRPELFGAALPAVGVMDMLRYHLFTIGWAWAGDYGTVDDPAQFRALLAYSPLHNLKKGTHYPATLVTTADHDDRVVPAHSFKFAATLQADQAGDAPVLIRIETRAGHGAGKPTTKRIEEAADRLAFLVRELHVDG